VSVLLPVPGTLTDKRGEFSLVEPSRTALPAQKKERPTGSLERKMPRWGEDWWHQGIIEKIVITGITRATTVSIQSKC
jgi:hypothetical protein